MSTLMRRRFSVSSMLKRNSMQISFRVTLISCGSRPSVSAYSPNPRKIRPSAPVLSTSSVSIPPPIPKSPCLSLCRRRVEVLAEARLTAAAAGKPLFHSSRICVWVISFNKTNPLRALCASA